MPRALTDIFILFAFRTCILMSGVTVIRPGHRMHGDAGINHSKGNLIGSQILFPRLPVVICVATNRYDLHLITGYTAKQTLFYEMQFDPRLVLLI